MARFRKIDVRIWGDGRFRKLSAPPPNAQSLWIYLLTGPHTTNIPGLCCAGEAALAEALGWPLPAFRKAFQEVAALGMAKADWQARVVWIPRAIRYNQPESPNVVKGWRSTWDEIPECELKAEARAVLRTEIPKGEAFVKAFEEALPEAFEEALPEGVLPPGDVHFSDPSANQEQEQETLFPEPAAPASEEEKDSKKATRKRDDLWDAVVQVTAADPETSKPHIGKVCKALRSSDPPYTPAEVLALPGILQARGFSLPLTPGTVQKYIGWTREKTLAPGKAPAPAETEEESTRRMLAQLAEQKAKYDGNAAGGRCA